MKTDIPPKPGAGPERAVRSRNYRGLGVAHGRGFGSGARGVRPPSADQISEPALREAAIRYLARFSATEKRLADVLRRKIARFGFRALRLAEDEAARAALQAEMDRANAENVPAVVAAMKRAGAVNDGLFAASRLKNLQQTGHSKRAVAAHLYACGVDGGTIGEVFEENREEISDLAAALALTRKRRIGAFARELPAGEDESRCGREEARLTQKALGALARAGFSLEIARQALLMDREEAEEEILNFRRR